MWRDRPIPCSRSSTSQRGSTAEPGSSHYPSSRRRATSKDRPSSGTTWGSRPYLERDWGRALHDYRRSEDLCRRLGDLVGEATSINNVGEILSDRGELDEATELFEQAREIFEAADYPTGVALTLSNLGTVMLRAGRHDVAERLLDEAIDTFRSIHAGAFVLDTQTRVAGCRVARARPVEGIRILDDVSRQLSDSTDPFVMSPAHRVRANALALSASSMRRWCRPPMPSRSRSLPERRSRRHSP